MPTPESHIKERLSNAYIAAIAAKAGATYQEQGEDFGIDGVIRPVKTLENGSCVDLGFPLYCQLKATTTSTLEDSHVVYEMKVNAYNKLVQFEGCGPCILVLLRLPRDPDEWLDLNEERLLLRNCCYWTQVSGPPSRNQFTKTIRIPRTQTFTPESVEGLLAKLMDGEL